MKRVWKVGVATVAGAFLSSLVMAPAQASSVKFNCGIVTCSAYLSRDLTRKMVTPSGVVGVVAGVFAPGPAKAIAVAAGIVSIKASEAAGKNQCLRIRYTRPTQYGSSVVGLYSDKSSYCHNT